MNPKITKINSEYEKNKAKISELQTRQRELERQRKEFENSEILELIHSYNLDVGGLAALLRDMNNKSTPFMGAITKKEDTDNEE